MGALGTLGSALLWTVRLALLAVAAYWAYDIRMLAIREYGRLIHEFDPWFNYRAAEYMFEHGLKKFFTWFDHTAWYPIGRPVGTTIYPGMQLTSVFIWHVLHRLNKIIPGVEMSLNDICVFMPTWFGSIASLVTGFLAAEASGFASAAPAAALVMSLVPAHIMRSMGGGFDNESIAVSAMVTVFWLWCRALRTPKSWWIGALAGLAHVYMVAAWGGYVFVINMVGAHAGLLFLLGRFDSSVYKAYTWFFIVGTLGAIQVPVVSWVPLKSLEQLGPLAVFLFYQVLEFAELQRKKKGYAKGSKQARALWYSTVFGAGSLVAVALAVLLQTGHFGPVSARVRGLFLKHTRTGNPLVDSVAEHQPTTSDAYWRYLHYSCLVAPLGWLLCFWKPTNAKIFLIQYGVMAYFFATKMNRLIILMGPISSALAGVALGAIISWSLSQLKVFLPPRPARTTTSSTAGSKEADGTAAAAAGTTTTTGAAAGGDAADSAAAGTPKDEAAAGVAASPAGKERKGGDKGDKGEEKDGGKKAAKAGKKKGGASTLGTRFDGLAAAAKSAYNSYLGRGIRLLVAAALVTGIAMYSQHFYDYCHMFATWSSSPSIVYKARLNNGQSIMVTDYLDAYKWLKRSTPEGSRVLSWWDYGYQISGIANRTTLADGNTWNHAHIALIGRCLTSPEKRAHELVRHLADYVLVWSGGNGDDLDKSPHIARIGNSVYQDICPNDPLCYSFGFYDRNRSPTPTMAASLLYKLVENNVKPGVTIDSNLWREVYTSKYGLVRIYKVKHVSKRSKAWLANPANRLCDRPGSWYCPGQYPPDLPERIGTKHADIDYTKYGHS